MAAQMAANEEEGSPKGEQEGEDPLQYLSPEQREQTFANWCPRQIHLKKTS